MNVSSDMNTTANSTLAVKSPVPSSSIAPLIPYTDVELFALTFVFVALSIVVVSLVICLLFRKGEETEEAAEASTDSGDRLRKHTTDRHPAGDELPPDSAAAQPSASLSEARRKFRESRQLLSQQQVNYGSTMPPR